MPRHIPVIYSVSGAAVLNFRNVRIGDETRLILPRSVATCEVFFLVPHTSHLSAADDGEEEEARAKNVLLLFSHGREGSSAQPTLLLRVSPLPRLTILLFAIPKDSGGDRGLSHAEGR